MASNRAANVVLRLAVAGLSWFPGGYRTPEPRRILVVRLGSLGDIVVALPVFHAIRNLYPNAHILLLTSPTRRGTPGACEVLAHDRTFDETIVYYEENARDPGFLRGLRDRIRALDIDTVIALPDNLSRLRNLVKHLALMAASGVRRTAGFRLVTPAEYTGSEVQRLLDLVRPLGPVSVEPFPWIRTSPDGHARAAEILRDTRGRTVVAMQCGAKRPANRWPAERFIELGKRLVRDQGVCLVLTGNAGERQQAETIARAISPDCRSAAGQTTVTELAALLQRCALLVSNDTGTMHVAAAMGTPVVAIFSGRDYPYRWHPFGGGHAVLRKPIHCSPCFHETCPEGPVPPCLDAISVDEVFGAVEGLLGNAALPSSQA